MRPTNTSTKTRSPRLGALAVSGSAFLGAFLLAVPASALVLHAASPCPRDMTLVGSSCVDRYEGSLVEVREDGSEAPFSAHQTPEGHKVRAVSKAGVTPQAHISMNDAQRACKASGKRLCHAREWKSACKGPEQTRYPYGNTRQENACVDTNRTSPTQVLYSGEHTARTMNDPRLNQLANTVEPTGAAAACTNEFGVHDMVGNVHEWADDGAFHGGYYLDTKINGEGCEYKTTAHAKSYYDYSTGFRCCADEGTVADAEDETPATPAAAPPAAKVHDAPRPFMRAAPGYRTDEDDAPSGLEAFEVSDGDRRSSY
jgi:sulfatase modifying factor 1